MSAGRPQGAAAPAALLATSGSIALLWLAGPWALLALGLFALGWLAAARLLAPFPPDAWPDGPAIVIDEVVGQPVALALWGAAFVLFRLFDIWKPWPVGRPEPRLLGVMAAGIVATAGTAPALIGLGDG